MERFFKLLFGGFLAIAIGVALGWGVRLAIRSSPFLNVFVPQAIDGTIVKGLLRTIRYTADQEEDLVNQTAVIMKSTSAQMSSATYIMRDVTTDTVVAQSNPDKRVPVASLTKLVTAILARRLIPETTKISLSREVINVYGNTAGFRVGETFTAGELMYPLLMVSSNDAAEAFARQYGRAKFIRAMNDFAQSIGAYRTYFADPSGLSPQNESTANDMAIILEWIYHNDPTILGITELKAKTVRTHTWTNPAHFLSWSYYLGGKNGYTDEANRTTAALFSVGSRKDVYAVVVLGSDNRDNDIVELLKKVK